MTQKFTLTSDDLTATVSTLGARLETLRFRGGNSVVLHADHSEWRETFAGALAGPVANRVQDGQFSISGQTYQMPRNEGQTTALHSGPNGLDKQEWDVITQDAQTLQLRCTRADGVGGLPGHRCFDVIYNIEGPCLTLDIRATTDAPTPISIAHHPYWRLGDPADHRLQVNADTYLPVDHQKIPTGEVLPVADTAFDHRTPHPLDPQTDHNFCLSNAPRRAPERVATLRGSGGLTLHIDSTEAGLQVYAGAHLPDICDAGIAPFAGIALEPQGWPNAVNQPGFPSVIATPDAPYHQITQYFLTIAP